MRPLLFLLLTCCCAFAIEEPTITEIVALSDTTVRLTWLSNDPATQGFYILRVDPYMSAARRIDTLSADVAEYIDTVLPGETYYYGVSAFSGDDVSPVTRYISIQMPGQKRILRAPILSATWDTVTTSVQLDIIDKSTMETGFRIFRADNFGAFFERSVLLSDDPEGEDTVMFTDNNVDIGSWYTYRVIVYDKLGEDSSQTDVFAYPRKRVLPTEKIVPGEKIAGLRIRYGNWALKQGDTICVQQDSIPFDSCTLIDVSDRDNPVFAGRIANPLPLRPQEPQSHTSLGNILLYRNRKSMQQYRFANGAIDSVCWVPIEYMDMMQPPQVPSIGQVIGSFNNNTVVTRYDDSYKYIVYDTYFYTQEKLVHVGSYWRSKDGPCNALTFLFFSAGRVHDVLIQGREAGPGGGKGSTGPECVFDGPDPVYPIYFSYDFSFDPRYPVEGYSDIAPDTVLKEYNGCITSDPVIQNAEMVFIDSSESVVYVFSKTEMSIYSYSLATGIAPEQQKTSISGNRFSFRYIPAGRRLRIGSSGIHDNAIMKIRLFSLNGVLLFSRNVASGRVVLLPGGINGMVLVNITAADKNACAKLLIAR